MTEESDLSTEQFRAILQREVGDLSLLSQDKLRQYSVDPERLLFESWKHDIEFFVFARFNSSVLFYEEYEEEFGVGEIGSSGRVGEWGTYPTLSIALSHFPNNVVPETGTADVRI